MNAGTCRAVAVAIVAMMTGSLPSGTDVVRDRQWHLDYLRVASAHQLALGEGVTIALVDSGVDAKHPDLRGNVVAGTVTAPNQAGDGRIDTSGHGTAMAGIIVGHGHGDGAGVLGMAPRAKVLPIRVSFELSTDGDRSGIAHAIDYAVDHDAAIINLSVATQPSEVVREAVGRAVSADIVVIAGIGNESGGLFISALATYPGVLAVGAVDRSGRRAPVSLTGPEVALAAPGVEIETTGLNGTYGYGTGTSEATAIVSGAAAEVVHRLTATATDAGPPGRDEEYGFGILNLVDALTKDVPPLGGSSTTPAAPKTSQATRTPNTGSGIPRGVLVAVVLLFLLAAAGTWTSLRRRAGN